MDNRFESKMGRREKALDKKRTFVQEVDSSVRYVLGLRQSCRRLEEIGEEDVTNIRVPFLFNGALGMQRWSKVQKEVSCSTRRVRPRHFLGEKLGSLGLTGSGDGTG